MTDKLKQGRTAARVGDLAEARRLLTEVTQEMPDNIEAWLELTGVVESLEEKQACLNRILALDPDHALAKASLARLEQKTASEPLFCDRHPQVETTLRCNRCGKPICPKCAQRTPVGFRCPTCISAIENRYYSSVKDGELNPYFRVPGRPFFCYVLLGLIVIIWAVMELRGGSTNPEILVQFGANYGPLILDGEIWRLFTSMFLHIGAEHLAFNSIALIIFGFEMERIYGRNRFLVLYLLSGLFGSLASFAFNGPHQFSAGASGAIFGIIGMNLAFFFFYRHRLGEYGRQRRNMILILIGINLVLGYTIMPVDNLAHIGGLVAGFLLGYIMAPRYWVDQTTSPVQVTDRASLLRRWWAPVLGLLSFSGGLWLALLFWTGSGGWFSPIFTGYPPSNSQPIEYGQVIETELSQASAAWTFEGRSGQVITIITNSNAFDAYLKLYGPDGVVLIEDDDSGLDYNAQIEAFRLPATGTYTIIIYSLDENFGWYELILELLSNRDIALISIDRS
jgi:membrane associated rhomboid family serine protease